MMRIGKEGKAAKTMLLHVLAAGFPFGGCTRNTVLPHGLQAGNRRRRCCGRLGFTKVAGLVWSYRCHRGGFFTGAPNRARHRGGGAGAQHCGLVYRMETSVTRRLDSFVGLVLC